MYSYFCHVQFELWIASGFYRKTVERMSNFWTVWFQKPNLNKFLVFRTPVRPSGHETDRIYTTAQGSS